MKKIKLPESKMPSTDELPGIGSTSATCEKVWSGVIARLRIYDQPESTGKKVFAYVTPGSNADYVGYSDDPNIIHALFKARTSKNPLMGYTNSQCRIEWVDF